jgi:hypothetical protein
MSNLTECAFPAQDTPAPNSSFSPGFTKHEYAAIIIAQGLVSKYNITKPEDQAIIAQLAKELAGEILNQF